MGHEAIFPPWLERLMDLAERQWNVVVLVTGCALPLRIASLLSVRRVERFEHMRRCWQDRGPPAARDLCLRAGS